MRRRVGNRAPNPGPSIRCRCRCRSCRARRGRGSPSPPARAHRPPDGEPAADRAARRRQPGVRVRRAHALARVPPPPARGLARRPTPLPRRARQPRAPRVPATRARVDAVAVTLAGPRSRPGRGAAGHRARRPARDAGRSARCTHRARARAGGAGARCRAIPAGVRRPADHARPRARGVVPRAADGPARVRRRVRRRRRKRRPRRVCL
jgi:hypothetical protein